MALVLAKSQIPSPLAFLRIARGPPVSNGSALRCTSYARKALGRPSPGPPPSAYSSDYYVFFTLFSDIEALGKPRTANAVQSYILGPARCPGPSVATPVRLQRPAIQVPNRPQIFTGTNKADLASPRGSLSGPSVCSQRFVFS